MLLGKIIDPVLKALIGSQPESRIIVTPDVGYFLHLDCKDNPLYTFSKTYEQARYEPFGVFHTSGSTGIPKPVIMTHGTFTAMDACQLIPSQGGQPTYLECIRDTRLFSGFPLFHTAGCSHLFKAAFVRGLTPVLPPPIPLTADIINLIHVHGDVQGSIMPPFFLTQLVENTESCANLSRLKYIGYSGGSLAKEIGDQVPSSVRLMTLFGTTEAATYPTELHEDDWQYMRYSLFLGHEYRAHDDELFELVILRRPELDMYQGVFATFPQLQEYWTNDLYSKHPTEADLWVYRGRSDDIISFSNSEKFNPVDMESAISAHPSVLAAVVVGQGRPCAALLIQPKHIPTTDTEASTLREKIWPTIEKANQVCPAHARIMKDFVLFTVPEKPMTWTGKETVTRKETVAMYDEELEHMYAMTVATAPIIVQKRQYNINDKWAIRRYIQDLVSLMLKQDSVGWSKNLFEMGLDSLLAGALTRQINSFIEEWRPDLDLILNTMIYANPSIEKLSSLIERNRKV